MVNWVTTTLKKKLMEGRIGMFGEFINKKEVLPRHKPKRNSANDIK